MSFNVSVVNDVFLLLKKKPEGFHGRKKMWRSKTPQRASDFSPRPTGVLRSPNRLLTVSIYNPVKCRLPVKHYFLFHYILV
jgi:hypothetical protein